MAIFFFLAGCTGAIETKITPGIQGMPLKVFVTGGAGFLGRHVVGSLLEGNTVRVYDSLAAGSAKPGPPARAGGADFVRGDIMDYGALSEACRGGFDAVIHLAARTDVIGSAAHPETTHAVNVGGTVNVLKCCVQNGIQKMILASSAAVYGDCGALPASEDAQTNPSSPYGRSKLQAERQVRMFSEKFGICGICLRIFNAYGRGQDRQHAGVIPRFIQDISNGRPVVIRGDGTQTRDFVWAGDVAAAFACALQATRPATYNIASGRSTSVNRLAEILAGVSGKEVARTYLGRSEHEAVHSAADTSLAREELGFESRTGLEEGLAELVSVPDQVCH